MSYEVEILDFAGRISNKLPAFINVQLKEGPVIDIISRVIDKSGKSPGDALIVFVSVVKYLWETVGGMAFAEMEKRDAFLEFVTAQRDSIIDSAVQKRMQVNVASRAFPLLDVINKKAKNLPVAVIELGASYGLIGWTLLEPAKILAKRDLYFSPGQKIAPNPRPIDHYLGLDIVIPDVDWLLACLYNPTFETYLRNFLKDIPYETEKFNLMETDAFGFSDFEPVKKLASQPFTLIVLTSFMFFQIGEEKGKVLKEEITKFTESWGAYWLNQAVTHPPDREERFFVEWNGERIIELTDSICSDWKWLTG